MAVLGCIADDFTGASDAASFLVKGGMSVRLFNGIPREEPEPEKGKDKVRGIVIALKSRTQERDQAVADSLRAAAFLKSRGVRQIYFKYCSTFDSTPEGNIGPVADALMERLKAPFTLLCPSLPANGRTVEGGKLFVYGVPLDESHMRNHPLTPMWDSRIGELMRPQSHYPCRSVSQEELAAAAGESSGPCYLIPDYREDEDGARIAEYFGDLPLLTGGSGLLEHLARRWTKQLKADGDIPESGTGGRAILLAGSCSQATLGQIEEYRRRGLPSIKLSPEKLLKEPGTPERVWNFVESQGKEPVLVYSSDRPEEIKKSQLFGRERVAAALEQAQASLAVRAVEAGYRRVIVAGGETSGAVTKALGFSSYEIGDSVAPGVPVMIPTERPDIRLVLKSGNFGQPDFFLRALERTEQKEEP